MKNNGQVGTKTRGIDLNFNNACNLRCKYCFTNSPKGDHVKEYLDVCAQVGHNVVALYEVPEGYELVKIKVDS